MPRASPRRYAGFNEHAHRLLFVYADAFPDLKPELLTILPGGVVENRKVLEPKEEKGLLAYPYIQTIAPTLVAQHLATPFVRKREDGSLALVQVWSANFNDSFKEEYDIQKENPDTSTFIPQAVQDVQKTMAELFGFATDDSSAPPVLFCHRESKNDSDVLIGTTEELLAYLEGNSRQKAEMDIVRLFKDGFETRVVSNDGKKKNNKTFVMASGQRHAIYIKNGHCKMACATPVEQFLNDRELFKEIPLNDEEDEIDDVSTEPCEGTPSGFTSGAYPLERADAFIKCKAAGNETDVYDGASTDGEPSEELFAAAPNLLGKLTRCRSQSKQKEEEETAAIPPTPGQLMGKTIEAMQRRKREMDKMKPETKRHRWSGPENALKCHDDFTNESNIKGQYGYHLQPTPAGVYDFATALAHAQQKP